MGKKKKSRAKKFGTEFREFITKGNVISLAVGVILGGAFQAVINSAVNDVFLPVLGMVTKRIDFSEAFLDLSRMRNPALEVVTSVELAKLEIPPRVIVSYGTLITAVINFLLIGLVVFAIVKSINSVGDAGKKISRRKKNVSEEPKPEPTTKECPFCCSEISIKATRCPQCTSELPEPEEETKTEETHEKA